MVRTTAQHGSAAIATAGRCCCRHTRVPAAGGIVWQLRLLAQSWTGGRKQLPVINSNCSSHTAGLAALACSYISMRAVAEVAASTQPKKGDVVNCPLCQLHVTFEYRTASCTGSLPTSINPCHGVFSVTDPTTGHNYRVSSRRWVLVSVLIQASRL